MLISVFLPDYYGESEVALDGSRARKGDEILAPPFPISVVAQL